jgi:hypothetical protein
LPKTHDLLRQSIYSRLAGYEDLNDTERLSNNPTFRLIGLEKIRDRGAALVKTGGRLVKHTRYYWMMLAEGHLTRVRFSAMLRRIALLSLPAN